MSTTTKVWVEGGHEGVDVKVAVGMVWLSLALEGMEIGVSGGGDKRQWHPFAGKLWEPGYRETINDPPKITKILAWEIRKWPWDTGHWK